MTAIPDNSSPTLSPGIFLGILSLFPLLLFLVHNTCHAQTPPKPSPAPALQAIDIKKMLAPWQQALEKSRREVVLIELRRGNDDIFRSKVGGAPYLPADQSIPTGSSGTPLYLLAQINFEEMPSMPDFPRKGMLQFFIADDGTYGANIEHKITEQSLMKQNNFRVVYHPTVTRESAQLAAPVKVKKAKDLPLDPSVPLLMSFTKTAETISIDDSGFEAVFGTSYYNLAEDLAKKHGRDESMLTDALSDFLAPHAFAHKIGGYPSFTQEDPRPSSSSLRLLLQLGSDDTDGDKLMWGDAGVGAFFIDPKDLQRGDFSRVMYNWDCY